MFTAALEKSTSNWKAITTNEHLYQSRAKEKEHLNERIPIFCSYCLLAEEIPNWAHQDSGLCLNLGSSWEMIYMENTNYLYMYIFIDDLEFSK